MLYRSMRAALAYEVSLSTILLWRFLVALDSNKFIPYWLRVPTIDSSISCYCFKNPSAGCFFPAAQLSTNAATQHRSSIAARDSPPGDSSARGEPNHSVRAALFS